MTGLLPTLRLVLRRDRIQLAVWLLLFVAMAASAYSTAETTYPDPAALSAAARAASENPSLVAMFGPVYSATVGAVGMIKMVVMMAAGLGLLTGLLVIRHTRADEESGRREMLGAAAISRTAAPIAALIESVALSLAIGVLSASTLIGMGADTRGSLTFGLLWSLTGIVFAAFALLCAQLTEGARAARGLFAVGLGAAYLLRALGDVAALDPTGGAPPEPGAASWLSPLGWAQQLRPYADDRLWPALLLVGLTAVLTAAALRLAAQRDLDAGLIRVGRGRPHASALLGTVEALTWRLHRGQLIGWSVGFLAVGTAFGGMGSAVDSLAGNPGTREMLERLGGSGSDLLDVFFGAEFSVMAMATAALGISMANTTCSEEVSGRAEYLLATPVPRLRWYVSHLIAAVVGTTVATFALGLGASLTAPRDLIAPAMAALPAVWVVTAVAALAGACSARWASVGWVVLAGCVLMMVADVLKLPEWLSRVSPFDHVATTPGADVLTGGTIALVLIAAGGLIVTAVAQSRRDLAT
ncbi:multidrug efflux ABC transporter permease [Tsukamurella serpentis]